MRVPSENRTVNPFVPSGTSGSFLNSICFVYSTDFSRPNGPSRFSFPDPIRDSRSGQWRVILLSTENCVTGLNTYGFSQSRTFIGNFTLRGILWFTKLFLQVYGLVDRTKQSKSLSFFICYTINWNTYPRRSISLNTTL